MFPLLLTLVRLEVELRSVISGLIDYSVNNILCSTFIL